MKPQRKFQINGGTQAVASIVACVFVFWTQSLVSAQTTLSGDHIIAGDLNVGTSGTTGSILITGETGGFAAPGLKVTGDGGVIFEGTFGQGPFPSFDTGMRMLWSPAKGIFHAGYSYIDNYLGNYSVSFGYEVYSVGTYSTASGFESEALGSGSVAIGLENYAYGSGAVVLGAGNFADQGGTALGHGTSAFSNGSTAMGYLAGAGAPGATGMGYSTFASGTASTALGFYTYADGSYSVATGNNTMSAGVASTAMGFHTSANSYASLSIGRYNVDEGSGETWNDGDPLLTIGNGTGDPADPSDIRSRNAFTVYKNGDVEIKGMLRLAAASGTAAPLVVAHNESGLFVNDVGVVMKDQDFGGDGIKFTNTSTGEFAYLGVSEYSGVYFRYAGNATHFRVEQESGGVGTMRAESYGVGEFGSELTMLNANGSATFGGNVGIGTTELPATLDVNGDLNVTGVIHMPRQGDIMMGEFGEEE